MTRDMDREPAAPFFTPKFTPAEVDALSQAVDAALRVLHQTVSEDTGPSALAALEALEAARAKLLSSRSGFDLTSGHHYTFEQLSQMGELGA